MEKEHNVAWAFNDLTPAKTQYLTHGYHRYPAKFIPQLVSQLIDEHSKPRERICDPFGGCGTTLVEAKLLGRASFGFDINPLAVLVTRAKTTAICPSMLSERFTAICRELEDGVVMRLDIIENHPNLERLLYWFGNSNLEQLISLKQRLEEEKEPAIRRFFMCALSHVLKNCSYWLATSTKPQKDKYKVPESPSKAFRKHASRMMDKNRLLSEAIRIQDHYESPAIMRKADARNLPLPDQSVDFIVTSPPYSTSYEYSDIHQLSVLLFGFCTSLREFRRDFIGSKNNNHHRDETLPNPKAIRTIQDLRIVDVRLAKAILNYFLDMSQVYGEISRVLRKGRKACIIVGDTELRGVSIPNAEIAVNQMTEAGFILEKAIERPIPGRVLAPFRDKNNGRFISPNNSAARKVYSHEYILVMRKK